MKLVRRLKQWMMGMGSIAVYPLFFMLIFLGALNIFQNLTYMRPSDGVIWIQDGDQIRVKETDFDVDTGFQVGDVLIQIDDVEIETIGEYEEFMRSVPLNSKHLYYLMRDDTPYNPWVEIRGKAGDRDMSYFLFAFCGWLYLIFLYLMISQKLTIRGKHYLVLFCFLTFLAFGFHPTERFNLLDWISFYLDHLGELLLPSAMLGYALTQVLHRQRIRWAAQLLHWVPSLVFLTLILIWFPPRVAAIDASTQYYFNRLLWAQTLWAGALLFFSLWTMFMLAPVSFLSQRLALVWILAWLPFGFLLWRAPWPFVLIIAGFTPLLLPTVMISRWSLKGDLYLGEIAKKTLVYVIVILVLLVGYIAFIRLFQLLLGTDQGGNVQTLISVLGIVLAALSYAPLRRFSSATVDRLIYGRRLEFLKSLFDFSGLIRADTDIDQFLLTILERMKKAFPIQEGAVFKTGAAQKVFQTVQRSAPYPGLIFTELPPELLNGELVRGSQVSALVIGRNQEMAFKGSDYICPLRVAGDLGALISFSLKRENGRLSPEEMRLLKNLANQCDVLMENMELYASVNQKANSIMQLKEANENIIESSRIGILTMDDMGHADSCNSAFAELTGRTKEQLISRRFEEMFKLKTLINQRQVESTITTEGIFLNRDRKEMTLEIQKTPLKSKENEVYGTLYLVEDVRERKETQQKLMQQEKLASIGLLAAGVAHEINTPLTGIASYSQLLGRDTNLSEDQRELLDLIQGQSQRAAHIVSSLLNFSRKEGAPKGPVNLAAVLDQTLRFMGHQIQKAKVQVTVDEKDGPLMIEGYPNQLQQVFVNLIVNALDAMPKGGKLTVAIKKFRDRAHMHFQDNGVGMEAGLADHIFDPFFTTKEVGKGTGLGLAVVYNIMQEHRGNIEVESDLGAGTTFILSFPLLAVKPLAKQV